MTDRPADRQVPRILNRWWSQRFDSPNPVDTIGAARPPDFICIGAEKAGTTWLWARLLKHPDVGVAASKELRFFTAGRHLDTNHFNALKILLENPREAPTNPHFMERLATEARLFFGSSEAYLRIFGHFTEAVVGEVSPQYCIQPPDTVRRIHDVAPDARIIYLLRDPVDRLISGGRMVLRRLDLGHDEERLWEECAHEIQRKFANAAFHLKKYEAIFGADQVKTFFFDDIRTRPGPLLAEVCDFIGAPHFEPDEEELRQRNNKGSSFQPSDAFKKQLYGEVSHIYDELEERFPDRIAAWRAHYE